MCPRPGAVPDDNVDEDDAVEEDMLLPSTMELSHLLRKCDFSHTSSL